MTDRQLTKRRILLVDDHAGITRLWKTLLEKTGHYIVQEENRSTRALSAVREFQPDLVLLDMDMPMLDGSQVAACIRTDRSIRHTAIVFLTSLVTPREVSSGKRLEGYPCLSKPTTIEELVQVIEESLASVCPA